MLRFYSLKINIQSWKFMPNQAYSNLHILFKCYKLLLNITFLIIKFTCYVCRYFINILKSLFCDDTCIDWGWFGLVWFFTISSIPMGPWKALSPCSLRLLCLKPKQPDLKKDWACLCSCVYSVPRMHSCWLLCLPLDFASLFSTQGINILFTLVLWSVVYLY